LTAKFWFAANELDENNWVVDFGSLKELKQLLQDQFDHTTCVSKHDPHLDEFIKLDKLGLCDLKIMDGVGIEKFAEWCHAAADNFAGVLTKMRCRCVRVEVFEHENNSAIYESYPEQKTQSTSGQVEQTKTVTKEVSKPDTQPKQSTKSTKPAPEKSGQQKTEGSWVDPKYKGRTKNTWLF
jgi:6-pyruvoyltetrahydropterin/6-carboxytetrahydropterin synthase